MTNHKKDSKDCIEKRFNKDAVEVMDALISNSLLDKKPTWDIAEMVIKWIKAQTNSLLEAERREVLEKLQSLEAIEIEGDSRHFVDCDEVGRVINGKYVDVVGKTVRNCK